MNEKITNINGVIMLKQLLHTIIFILTHPLTRQNRVKAILNFIRWQIGTILLDRKIIIPWVDDCKFISARGETGLTGNLYTGFMEHEDMVFLLHSLQSEETFVDVGANIGAYTILASKCVKANSISFEPLPGTVERLKDQININNINDFVDIRNKGVGDKKGEFFFTNNKDTMNKVSLAENIENATKVEVTTLDSELDKNKKYFIKIDVEGFEFNVLQGGGEILSSPNTIALIIELNSSGEEYGHSNLDIHNKIITFNFIPVAYDPMLRIMKKLDGYNKTTSNTIYIKDFDMIMKRCAVAPRRCVHTANGIFV